MRDTVVEAMDDLAAREGELQLVRCLASETLEWGVRMQRSDLDVDHTELVSQATLVLAAYPDVDNPDLAELAADLDLQPSQTDAVRIEALDGAIAQLAEAGLGLDAEGCPLGARA